MPGAGDERSGGYDAQRALLSTKKAKTLGARWPGPDSCSVRPQHGILSG